MNANPYQPPKAELVDTPEILPPRPRAVSIALGLVLAGVLLQVLANIYTLQETNFHFERPWSWAFNGAGFVLFVFLCHQISKRRSWPRIVLLLVTLMSFVQVCLVIGAGRRYLTSDEMLAMLPRFFIMQGLPVAMDLAALHLLFFSSGNWFRRQDPG